MIARLLISSSLENRIEEINKTLASHLTSGNSNHPDLLYFPADSKLGMEQAKKIKQHFALKPYSAAGRIVILEDASTLTTDAQNALLKTMEELPDQGLFILGASSEDKFLPTVLSRIQKVILERTKQPIESSKYDIEKLLESSIEDRFEYVEKLKDKKEFLQTLVLFFRKEMLEQPNYGEYVKELLQAEEWAAQNVNIRAILEYLMLVMPKTSH